LTDLHYIDTSYLAPYYLPEVSSEVVERKLLKHPVGSLVISPLVRSEFASLLSRKSRTKEMDAADARRTMTALDTHLAAGMLRMVSTI
jgi:predicted nucleic acid-binding protein